jgi:hypothetical protein
MKTALLLTLLIASQAFALEVDEKLTFRVLKLSETRKTMLVNRGTEDGLNEGDHAKFYVSAGVVARGVIVKVSPARSVWSIYRLVNADFVLADAVMSLKITPPVKITQDESKMLVVEDVPTEVAVGDPGRLGIPMAEGANDLPPGVDPNSAEATSRAELLALQTMGPGNIREKNFELWTAISISSLGSKTSANTAGTDSFSGSDARTQLALAGEFYAKDEQQWWSRFSPFGFVNIHNRAQMAFQGSKQQESATEFGAGMNWHPWSMPSVVNDFVPFFGFSMALGTARSTYEPGGENPGAPASEAQGTTLAYSFGGGFKFYTNKGWGARAVLDYYMRSDKMKDENVDVSWTRNVSGPRLWVGMGYRW